MTQTALITGGAKRLGRAIALDLAEAGYDIALHFNTSLNQAEQAAADIRGRGVQCVLFQANLMESLEVEKLIPTLFEQMPGLSVLINGASIYQPATIAQTTVADLQANFAIHTFAPFLLIRDFAKYVGAGNVINIVDTKIAFEQYDYAAYLLSKKSLAELTRMAALEFAPGIRVNAILPGVVLPPAGREEGYLEWRREGLPLQKTGSPENITKTVRFLLDNDFVTGQLIAVDGGEALTSEGRSVAWFDEQPS